MEIAFSVYNQKISRIDTNEIIADSQNYLKAQFVFATDEWVGIKTAVFKHDGIPYKMLLDDNNMCLVPWEVIKEGCFSVSVFCGNLITANEIIVPVRKSGYVDIGVSHEPTPDIYIQIIEKLNSMEIGSVDEATIKAAVDEYLAENPITSVSDIDVLDIVERAGYTKTEDIENLVSEQINETIKESIDTYFVENPVNMEGYVKTEDIEDIISEQINETAITSEEIIEMYNEVKAELEQD